MSDMTPQVREAAWVALDAVRNASSALYEAHDTRVQMYNLVNASWTGPYHDNSFEPDYNNLLQLEQQLLEPLVLADRALSDAVDAGLDRVRHNLV